MELGRLIKQFSHGSKLPPNFWADWVSLMFLIRGHQLMNDGWHSNEIASQSQLVLSTPFDLCLSQKWYLRPISAIVLLLVLNLVIDSETIDDIALRYLNCF